MSVGDKLAVGDILGLSDILGDTLGTFVVVGASLIDGAVEMLGELLSKNATFANGYFVGTSLVITFSEGFSETPSVGVSLVVTLPSLVTISVGISVGIKDVGESLGVGE
jgi:hypothetical protein